MARPLPFPLRLATTRNTKETTPRKCFRHSSISSWRDIFSLSLSMVRGEWHWVGVAAGEQTGRWNSTRYSILTSTVVDCEVSERYVLRKPCLSCAAFLLSLSSRRRKGLLPDYVLLGSFVSAFVNGGVGDTAMSWGRTSGTVYIHPSTTDRVIAIPCPPRKQ